MTSTPPPALPAPEQPECPGSVGPEPNEPATDDRHDQQDAGGGVPGYDGPLTRPPSAHMIMIDENPGAPQFVSPSALRRVSTLLVAVDVVSLREALYIDGRRVTSDAVMTSDIADAVEIAGGGLVAFCREDFRQPGPWPLHTGDLLSAIEAEGLPECDACDGSGKAFERPVIRCPDCRGTGVIA